MYSRYGTGKCLNAGAYVFVWSLIGRLMVCTTCGPFALTMIIQFTCHVRVRSTNLLQSVPPTKAVSCVISQMWSLMKTTQAGGKYALCKNLSDKTLHAFPHMKNSFLVILDVISVFYLNLSRGYSNVLYFRKMNQCVQEHPKFQK